MTTKEFIKLLKEADPTGNAHIRLGDGVPIYVECKAGYYDGPYNYIDEDNNFVLSSKDLKVDVYCFDLDEWIERLVNIHNPMNWEEIKEKIKFELTYCYPEERIKARYKNAKECYEEWYKIKKTSFDNWEEKTLELMKKGERFFIDIKEQNKYNFRILENGKLKITNQGICDVLFNSKKLKRIKNDFIKDKIEIILKK